MSAPAGHSPPHSDEPAPHGGEHRLPGGRLGQLGPYLLLAAATAWLATHWGHIPDPMITHWNLEMEPDGWAERSSRAVFGLLAFGVTICATLTLVSLGLLHRAKVPAGEEERAAEWQRRRASLQVLLVANWLSGLLVGIISLYPLAQSPGRMKLLVGTTLALSVVGPMAMLVWIGLRLAPLHRGHRQRTAELGREHWKLGVLYHDPAEPAIFVEKRVGIGYTINFAHREVWAFLVLMLIVPVLLLAWMMT